MGGREGTTNRLSFLSVDTYTQRLGCRSRTSAGTVKNMAATAETPACDVGNSSARQSQIRVDRVAGQEDNTSCGQELA